MSQQTSYTINHGNAYAGMVADCRPREIGSFKNEETTAGLLKFGRAVVRGTATDQCKLPTATGDDFLGFVVLDNSGEIAIGGSTTDLIEGYVAGVMREGNIFVEVEDTVAAGSGVFVRYAGKKQVQTIVFDADLVTSNVVNGDIGGVAISPVTFDTDNATTMANLATEIQSFAGVETAVSNGTDTITVTTLLDGADQTAANFVVTLGAGQAGVTETETVAAVASADRGLSRSDADSTTAKELDWAFEDAGVAGDIVKIRKK